jgi:hypothetical protein
MIKGYHSVVKGEEWDSGKIGKKDAGEMLWEEWK